MTSHLQNSRAAAPWFLERFRESQTIVRVELFDAQPEHVRERAQTTILRATPLRDRNRLRIDKLIVTRYRVHDQELFVQFSNICKANPSESVFEAIRHLGERGIAKRVDAVYRTDQAGFVGLDHIDAITEYRFTQGVLMGQYSQRGGLQLGLLREAVLALGYLADEGHRTIRRHFG